MSNPNNYHRRLSYSSYSGDHNQHQDQQMVVTVTQLSGFTTTVSKEQGAIALEIVIHKVLIQQRLDSLS